MVPSASTGWEKLTISDVPAARAEVDQAIPTSKFPDEVAAVAGPHIQQRQLLRQISSSGSCWSTYEEALGRGSSRMRWTI